MAKKKSAKRSSLNKQLARQTKGQNTEIEAFGIRDPWLDQPKNIKRFVEQRPYYERLCTEISYTLRSAMLSQKIIFASVTERAKTLDSFLEKNARKQYNGPFDMIEDFAGVRVVVLYQDDLPLVESIIRDEFEVLKKEDKSNNLLPNQFGYGAVHFIVKLGKKSSGARYDEINDLKCEIQTRTVVQDAWAIIQHHLVYKNEALIPQQILRSLNRLAGLFEVADDQFQKVRNQRETYLMEIESKREFSDLLKSEIDADTLSAYLKRKFPDLLSEIYPPMNFLNVEGGLALKGALAMNGAPGLDATSLYELDRIVDCTAAARAACFVDRKTIPTRESSLGLSIVLWSFHQLLKKGFGKNDVWQKLSGELDTGTRNWLEIVSRYAHLVDDSTVRPTSS
jgi:putative GTP pyrophosphokinase